MPGLVLLGAVVFPGVVATVHIDRPRSIRLMDHHPGDDVQIACFYPSSPEPESGPDVEPDATFPIGVVCRVIEQAPLPDLSLQVVLKGVRRVRRVAVAGVEPFLRFVVEPLREADPDGADIELQVMRCVDLVGELVRIDTEYPTELVNLVAHNKASPGRFADLLGSRLRLPIHDRRALAATLDAGARLDLVEAALRSALVRGRVHDDVVREVRTALDKDTRSRLLREQLRAIRLELGDEPDAEKAVDEVRGRVEAAGLPPGARDAAHEDLDVLRRATATGAEYPVAKAHLEWLLKLPWTASEAPAVDLARAKAVLDRNHVGLADVKERILEFLAVLDRDPARVAQPICLVGPPGTGKTSLGRSIAEASGREFVRASAAGIVDEGAIKGVRRGRLGAGPGLLLEGLRRAGTREPVFMLDEIDALEGDDVVDATSALAEALDPESATGFLDLYLGAPFDVSRVLFVATASVAFDVPRSIRDRMEVLTLAGYTPDEKFQIARRRLVPRALARAGFLPTDVTFTDDALHMVVAGYTREAGVSGLERFLARACRRLALLRRTGLPSPSSIDSGAIVDLLGQPPHETNPVSDDPAVGVATGLAWTADGGVVQVIEAIAMPGSGRIVVTGRLGDVMRESADIAYSWVRANGASLGLDDKRLRHLDLHVHAPEGGVRKDGPSAGVALVTAIVSAFAGRPVRSDVAMSGELTLHGRVLEVAGIREKVSAAHRAGIRHVLLPASNRKDVDILSPDLRAGMRFEFLDQVSEYLTAAWTSASIVSADELSTAASNGAVYDDGVTFEPK